MDQSLQHLWHAIFRGPPHAFVHHVFQAAKLIQFHSGGWLSGPSQDLFAPAGQSSGLHVGYAVLAFRVVTVQVVAPDGCHERFASAHHGLQERAAVHDVDAGPHFFAVGYEHLGSDPLLAPVALEDVRSIIQLHLQLVHLVPDGRFGNLQGTPADGTHNWSSPPARWGGTGLGGAGGCNA